MSGSQAYRSGEKAPVSGLYETGRGVQAALSKGERFPPSRTGWRLKRAVSSTATQGAGAQPGELSAGCGQSGGSDARAATPAPPHDDAPGGPPPPVTPLPPGWPAPTAPPGAIPDDLRGMFHTWAAVTLSFLDQLEQSGLIENGQPEGSVSHALAAASLEVTHAGLVYGWVFGHSVSIGDPMAEAGHRFGGAADVR